MAALKQVVVMNWKEEYKKKLVSAEEAVKVVRSGDKVVFSPHADHPKILGPALAARRAPDQPRQRHEPQHEYRRLGQRMHERPAGRHQ